MLSLTVASCSVAISFAQDSSYVVDIPSEVTKIIDVTYVSKTAVISKYHNEVELENVGKLELTQLYIERVRVLTEVMPYMALSTHAAGEDLQKLGVPKTKENVSDLLREVKSKEEYLNTLDITLQDVVPYSDKDKIIWSILFMEDIIHRIEAQKKSY